MRGNAAQESDVSHISTQVSTQVLWSALIIKHVSYLLQRIVPCIKKTVEKPRDHFLTVTVIRLAESLPFHSPASLSSLLYTPQSLLGPNSF